MAPTPQRPATSPVRGKGGGRRQRSHSNAGGGGGGGGGTGGVSSGGDGGGGGSSVSGSEPEAETTPPRTPPRSLPPVGAPASPKAGAPALARARAETKAYLDARTGAAASASASHAAGSLSPKGARAIVGRRVAGAPAGSTAALVREARAARQLEYGTGPAGQQSVAAAGWRRAQEEELRRRRRGLRAPPEQTMCRGAGASPLAGAHGRRAMPISVVSLRVGGFGQRRGASAVGYSGLSIVSANPTLAKGSIAASRKRAARHVWHHQGHGGQQGARAHAMAEAERRHQQQHHGHGAYSSCGYR